MAEHKYKNTSINVSGSSFQTGALTLVAQGADTDQRIGTRTLGTSIEIMYNLRHCQPDGALDCNFFESHRLVFYIWKDDTAPTKTTLFDGVITTGTPALNPQRPFNREYTVKRKILWNKYFSTWGDLDNGFDNFLAGDPQKVGRIIIPLSKIKNKLNEINFQPGGTAATNHIYYAFLSSAEGNSGILSSVLSFISRYNFIDF